ncbi:MAG: glycosyltransferase family 1 protein [Armatimonadetes bacterium]|nr:glycosyltransferase family 1 protein [Armatimonadota bacterium]
MEIVVASAAVGGHVSMRIASQLTTELAEETGWQLIPPISPGSAKYLNRIAATAPGRAMMSLGSQARGAFTVLMNIHNIRFAGPALLKTKGKRAALVHDAWPQYQADIVDLAARYGLDHVFVTARDAVRDLSAMDSSRTYEWMPESLAREPVQPLPLGEKSIDVFQIGRRYETYHEAIAPALESAEKSYLYEREKGVIAIPDHSDFLRALGQSKVSICFPSSLTHPERSGNVETMTLRYLQSMASNCIIVGKAPAEMIDLFGYNPVVEADLSDPTGQILEILADTGRYADLVESNARAVMENHRWSNRIELIRAYFTA